MTASTARRLLLPSPLRRALPCILIATLLIYQPLPLYAQGSAPASEPDKLPSAPPDSAPLDAAHASPAKATVPQAEAAPSVPTNATASSTASSTASAPPSEPPNAPPSASSSATGSATPSAPPANTAEAPEAVEPDKPVVDMALVRSVIATALEFLAPRTLEAHTSREFTLWGLGCLTALDPMLTLDTRGADIRLLTGQTTLLAQPAPTADNVEQWAKLAVDFISAARAHSTSVGSASREDLVQAFFDELFNHLDPYSRYIGPSSATTDRQARVGGEADAGVSLTRKGRDIVISAVNANGPAWTATVDPGDKVLAVNNRLTAGQSVETVTGWLRGEEDSRVTLRLLSPGNRRGHTIVLRRAKVPPETVFAFASGPLVVLRVTSFSSDTAEEMSQYLDQATQDPNLKGLIIDLRGNRGGVLQQAVTAAALLLDRGVAAVTDGRDQQANHIWAVQGGDMTKGLPIAILVDGRTASAAEILAAALADHRRAVVIGSSTLGKGLVQTVAQLPDEGELFVTWSRVIAPLHWPLQGLGVMPQVCTSLGEAEITRQMHDLAAGKLDNQPAVEASRLARFPLPVSRILAIRKACPAALGSDRDLDAARALLENPKGYKTAIAAMPDDSASPGPATHE
ncbi:S41 family peptidase [Acetobacter orleanensis]|uniref:S41 family peptidase n=1 Tax=Acetobacter orleanensis TaxID=104099 RepID=UPI0009E5CA36|nr:S41 family peptidase [Acetobacter orleanensis]PCD80635.1 peptidase S41 [Acetobacter orleanensis]